MIATWSEARDAYDEFINSTTDEIKIMGVLMIPARVLQNIDPIAYRCGLADFLDAEGIDSDDFED